MAKKLGADTGADGKPADDKPQVLENVQAREACFQKGIEDLYTMLQRKAELEEEHLSDIKAQIKKHKRNMKADLNISAKDLDLVFKIYAREQDAKTFDDADEGDAIQSDLQEMFNYLHRGEMVNFLDALELDSPA